VIKADLWVDVDQNTKFVHDVRVVDDMIEISIGSQLGDGSCLHLTLPDPETCERLLAVIADGRDEFAAALRDARTSGAA